MKNNNLYLKLDRLKKLPTVQQYSEELVQKHMILETIDTLGIIEELLETAGYKVVGGIDTSDYNVD